MRVGRGSVCKRHDSPYWWIKWYRDGRAFRESTNTSKKTDAQGLLAKRLGSVARGEAVSPSFDKLTFKDAANDVINDYLANGKRSIDGLRRRITKHLEPYFAGRRMSTISAVCVRAYITKRQSDLIVIQKPRRIRGDNGHVIDTAAVTKAVSNAEINRELAALKRMFSLAIQSGKLTMKPCIPMLAERNVRRGFFELQQFEAVMRNCRLRSAPVFSSPTSPVGASQAKFSRCSGGRLTSCPERFDLTPALQKTMNPECFL